VTEQPAAVQAQPGAELPSLTRLVTQEKIERYASASGDANPLHIDPAFAARSRFGGTVAHGMLVLAYLSDMLTRAFGEHYLTSGRLRARFRAPARPGDEVTCAGRVTDVRDGHIFCQAECRNQAGEVLISADVELTL
jgi:3-hydroxybutyryl-CoA dehydratase